MRRHITAKNDWHEQKEGVYHVSSSWTCFRRQVYARRGVEEERSDESGHGIFEMGHRVESVIYAALQRHFGEAFVRNDIPCAHQAEDHLIVGKSDPVLFDWNFRPLRVYEVKSVKGPEEVKAKKPEAKHFRQSSFYAHEIGAPEVHLVYAGRNSIWAPKSVVVSKAKIAHHHGEVVEYFRKLHAANTKGVLPPGKPFDPGECWFCPFRMQCKRDGNTVLK